MPLLSESTVDRFEQIALNCDLHPGNLLGFGIHSACFADLTDSTQVILVDSSRGVKKLAYQFFGMLIADYQTQESYNGKTISVFVIPKMPTMGYKTGIDQTSESTVNYLSKTAYYSYVSSTEYRQYSAMKYGDYLLSYELYLLLDVATHPKTPEHLTRFFAFIIDYALKHGKELWLDSHGENWFICNGLVYPLDVINFTA